MHYGCGGEFIGDIDVGDLLPARWNLKNEKYSAQELFEQFKLLYDKMQAVLEKAHGGHSGEINVIKALRNALTHLEGKIA